MNNISCGNKHDSNTSFPSTWNEKMQSLNGDKEKTFAKNGVSDTNWAIW